MWTVLLFVAVIHLSAAQQNCSFDDGLLGNWTSTNYGTLIFSNSTPHLSISFNFLDGSSSTTEFDCVLKNGTQHVLKSTATIKPFDNNYEIYVYICLDLQKAGDYSYYYYQQSPEVAILQSQRVKAFPTTDTVTYSDVCLETLPAEEFHTMVKQGFETQAAIQCPDPLLLSGSYIYIDATGSYCNASNATVDSCNQNLTNIQFNDSVVTDNACKNLNPGYSVDGKLGCVANIHDTVTNQYYVSLYNYDGSVDDVTTYQFTCVAVTSDENGTVFISMSPTDCEEGQNATVLPTPGAKMEFTPFETCGYNFMEVMENAQCTTLEVMENAQCTTQLNLQMLALKGNGNTFRGGNSCKSVPFTTPEPAKDWTWLIVLCVVLFLLLVIVLVIILISLHWKKKQREKAREKKILITEEHPLAEVSMPIDAPNSMEPMNDTAFFENREDLFRTPRGKKKEKAMVNPMSESSLILDFKSPRWSIPNAKPTAQFTEDPFSEMSNGEIVPISPVGSKTVRSMLNKQRSFSTAFLEAKPNPLKTEGLVRHASVGVLSERSFVKSRPASQRTTAPQTPKTERSFRAASRKSAKTVTQTPGPVSVKAPSVAPRPNIAPSVKSNKSYRSNKSSNRTTKVNPAQSEKPKTVKTRPARSRGVVSTKLGRSTTSTKLGSVTHRKPPVNRETIRRSKTVVGPSLPVIAKAEEGERIEAEAMNEFLAAEAGSSISGTARSKKASPRRKSILKKTSAYLPIDDADEPKMTDKYPTYQPSEHLGGSSSVDVMVRGSRDSPVVLSSSLSERDSFLGLKAKQNQTKTTKTPIPSKAAWH